MNEKTKNFLDEVRAALVTGKLNPNFLFVLLRERENYSYVSINDDKKRCIISQPLTVKTARRTVAILEMCLKFFDKEV